MTKLRWIAGLCVSSAVALCASACGTAVAPGETSATISASVGATANSTVVTPRSSSSTATTDAPAWVLNYAGALASKTTFVESGLALLPPPGRPIKPSSVADDACTQKVLPCWPGPATTVLALGTENSSGTAAPDGTLIPLFKDRLIYVTTWVNTTCPPRQGNLPQFSDTPVVIPTATTPEPLLCTAVNVVDATTGEALYAFVGTPSPVVSP